ncbi:hypothetical protein ATW55_13050 [Ferroacidibacillus organovorans]|uniref:Septum site-determining protein MinC N-terminal domain-containing protein n=1 Tax=Ferroacidibacillus organovorans TaxID=1765683 RepID=A0A124IWC7_9BACL|nr:hypothetical protein ATW55_13050 [Ferroacidibacillus organovorans]
MSRFATRPSTTTIKETVSIKGIRNGLLFILRDDMPFRDVLSALEDTLRKDASQGEETSLLTAYVQLGNRRLSDVWKNFCRQDESQQMLPASDLQHGKRERHRRHRTAKKRDDAPQIKPAKRRT